MRAKTINEGIKHLSGRTPAELEKLQRKYQDYVVSLGGNLCSRIQDYFDEKTDFIVDVDSHWKDGKKVIDIHCDDFMDYHEFVIDHNLEERFEFNGDFEPIGDGVRITIELPFEYEDEELDESIKHLTPKTGPEVDDYLETIKDWKPDGYMTLNNFGGIEVKVTNDGEGVTYRYNYGAPEIASIHEADLEWGYDEDNYEKDDDDNPYLRQYFMVGDTRYYLDEFWRND